MLLFLKNLLDSFSYIFLIFDTSRPIFCTYFSQNFLNCIKEMFFGQSKAINSFSQFSDSGFKGIDCPVGFIFLLFGHNLYQLLNSVMGNQGIENNEHIVLRSESMMTKILMGEEKEIIEHFKSQNIAISDPINQMGDTLGHYAAYRGHIEVLEYLYSQGDDFNIVNTRNLTAVDVALPQIRERLFAMRRSNRNKK